MTSLATNNNSNVKSKKKIKIVKRQTFDNIKPIIWAMQCELRNREGITGINCMHHINLAILIKMLDNATCESFNIPVEYSYESIKDLDCDALYERIYNRNDIENCLLHYIRMNNRFGFNDEIIFEINNPATLHYLITKVKDINVVQLNKRTDLVGDIYEYFIDREAGTMRDLGQYFTDRQVINYLISLANPKLLPNGNIETIYDSASGTGGFLTQSIEYLNNKHNNINWVTNQHNIYGHEINRNTFALLKLNMYFSTGQILNNIFMNDSLKEDPSLEDGYDVILMNPPFGVKNLRYTEMNERIKNLHINGTKGEVLFLQSCMANLSNNGRCCIVLPDGILKNSTKMHKETRKYLLDNFTLHKVIKLEGDFFKNTGARTIVLFFENTGNGTEEVEFVEVTKNVKDINTNVVMTVNIDSIKNNNYSLNMNLYKESNLNVRPEYSVNKIKDICTVVTGRNIPKPRRTGTEYPYYGSNGVSGHVDTYLFEGKYILHGDQGSVVNSIKFVDKKFYPSNHTLVVKPKDNTVNIKYLYYYIKLCVNIEELLSGTVIQEIRHEDFNNISIVVPPLEIQEKIVEEIDNISVDLNLDLTIPKEEQIKELKNKLKEISDDGRKVMDQLFINTGQILNI